MQHPPLRWRSMRRFQRYLKEVRWSFSASLVLLVLIALLTISKALIITPVVNTFMQGHATVHGLRLLCLVIGGIFVAQAILNWAYMLVARAASTGIVRAVRSDLFSHLMKQSLGYFSARASSDLTSRVVNDVQVFEGAAVGALQAFLRDVIQVVLIVATILIFQWRLGLICLAILFVVGLILRAANRVVRRLSHHTQRMVSKVAQQLTEMIGGIELILGFGLGGRWQEQFEEVNNSYREAQMKVQASAAHGVVATLILIGIGIGAVLYLMGGSVLRGEIDVGRFASFLFLIYLLQTPAQSIGKAAAMMARGFAAGSRALDLLKHEPDLKDPEQPVPFSDPVGRIEFREVSFSYKQSPVLRDLSFTVEPGELVVMVGDSGAGKSTVAKLLQRFYDPDHGSVSIDGVSVRDILREDLYRSVGYVAQEVYLFDGTVDFNLRVGKPDATAEEIAQAVRIACVDDFLSDLPEGLETFVGERGVRLSGGQRQRIAIARAVLTDARILVFDEATSALDMDLEQRILQNLVAARSDRTIFAITHRLSLASIADRVLVLKQGCLVEEGRAADLAGQSGEFARLEVASRSQLVRADRSSRASPLRARH